MSAERLVAEFGAQDVGAYMVALVKGNHIRVAEWNNANQVWMMLPAGTELLAPAAPVAKVASVAPTPEPKQKAAPKTKDLFSGGDEE